MAPVPQFRPIRLPEDRDLCLRFITDTYVCSFGDAERFLSGKLHYLGPDAYVAYLEEKLRADPRAAVHVWLEERVVGQLELGAYRNDPSIGYVFLYYLIPEVRGSGLAEQLDRYACEYLRSVGFARARLSASASNARALRFYVRMGWHDLGPSPSDPAAIVMEKVLVPGR